MPYHFHSELPDPRYLLSLPHKTDQTAQRIVPPPYSSVHHNGRTWPRFCLHNVRGSYSHTAENPYFRYHLLSTGGNHALSSQLCHPVHPWIHRPDLDGSGHNHNSTAAPALQIQPHFLLYSSYRPVHCSGYRRTVFHLPPADDPVPGSCLSSAHKPAGRSWWKYSADGMLLLPGTAHWSLYWSPDIPWSER